MKKIRKGDMVISITGRDKGVKGEVIQSGDNSILVQGINMVKKHTKPNPGKNIKGGVVRMEAPISASNVMLLDPKTDEPIKVRFKILADGSKVRYSKKKTGDEII